MYPRTENNRRILDSNILGKKKKVVQLKNPNISQKTFHYIIAMHIFIKLAYPISNLFMGQTSQNIKRG